MVAETTGFGGIARWIDEGAGNFGLGMPSSGVIQFFSDSMVSAKVGVKAQGGPIRDIGSYNALDYEKGVLEYVVEVVYRFQKGTGGTNGVQADFLSDLLLRKADFTLKSWYIEIGAGIDGAAFTYYQCKGCKPDMVTVDSKNPAYITVTVQFFAANIVTSAALPALNGTTTRASAAIATAYMPHLGAKVESPSGSAIATATKSWKLTCKHNLVRVEDAGTANIVKLIKEGARDVSVTCDLTADDGGKTLFDAMTNRTKTNIVLYFSATTGDPKITVTTALRQQLDLNLNEKDAIVIPSITMPGTGTAPIAVSVV
ncbi:MAG: hypothetical protein ACYDCK_01480 [Thermoplasmatota archaeon]